MNPPGWAGVERIPDSWCHLTAGGAVRQRMVSNGSSLCKNPARSKTKRMALSDRLKIERAEKLSLLKC
jgi:hypothetical protein